MSMCVCVRVGGGDQRVPRGRCKGRNGPRRGPGLRTNRRRDCVDKGERKERRRGSHTYSGEAGSKGPEIHQTRGTSPRDTQQRGLCVCVCACEGVHASVLGSLRDSVCLSPPPSHLPIPCKSQGYFSVMDGNHRWWLRSSIVH